MERMWQERAEYGHFFYRIPNGESAADAYDRVSGFNESLWRGFGEEGAASVVVIVTHGLMARVFLMRWFRFSVEYFEDLRNVGHCEFVVMEREGGERAGKFVLRSRLRTWSELKREKKGEIGGREGEGDAGEGEVPVRRTWGGLAEGGEEQGKRVPKRKDTADWFVDEVRGERAKDELEHAGKGRLSRRVRRTGEGSRTGNAMDCGSDDSEEEGREEERHEQHQSRGGHSPSPSPSPSGATDLDPANAGSASTKPAGRKSSHSKSFRPRILSPRHIAALEVGRDGGSSRSGAASLSGSDDSEDRAYQKGVGRRVRTEGLGGKSRGKGSGRGADDRGGLGLDRGGVDEDGEDDENEDGDEDEDEGGDENEKEDEDEDEDESTKEEKSSGRDRDRDESDIDMRRLERMERHDRSLRGSVY